MDSVNPEFTAHVLLETRGSIHNMGFYSISTGFLH